MGDKKDEPIIVPGCPMWMVTMGDAMSLLMTFFVLMLTFSTVNEEQLMNVVGMVQGARSLTEQKTTREYEYRVTPRWDDDVGKTEPGPYHVGQTEDKISESLATAGTAPMEVRFNHFMEEHHGFGFKHSLSLKDLHEGMAVNIDVDALFADNSADLKADAYRLLEGMANLAINVDQEIRLTLYFHDDNDSQQQRSGSRWGLAMRRLETIRDTFVNRYRLPSTRFGIGAQPTKDDTTTVQVLLVEKLDNKAMSIKEFLSSMASVTAR